MRKEYKSPAIEIVKVDVSQMICTSTVYSSVDGRKGPGWGGDADSDADKEYDPN